MSTSGTYLDRILARHREVAASDARPVQALLDAARAMPPPRGFRDALVGLDHLAVISEVKRRSPSKGDLFAGLDPAQLALDYARGGASCLSVLTDAEFFGGSADDLGAARAAVSLPVLRKDFTVCERDVLDARLMGADCVLLIAAALTVRELVAFHALAIDVGLDVLVEIHDERELEAALAAEVTLVGVNQRDLVTFAVDHERALRMAGVMPSHVVKVAESGVRGPDDAGRLYRAGYHAVLVGETLVTSGDPAGAVAALVAA
ncbi:MAG: indole-3-glycerol phosphate synthase [Actinomycetota bacterium]